MDLLFQYLKQRGRLYLGGILFFAVFFLSFALYRLPLEAVAYPCLLCVLLAVILSVADFLRIKKQHEALNRIQSITDVIELSLPEAEDLRDADYQRIIRLLGQEHSALAAQADQSYADMVDYYTLWAHQIKTPIASMELRLEHEDSPLARKLSADLNRVEQYVEMVLTFLRLHSETTDYVIKEQDLDSIVRSAVKKFSHEFIERKLSLHYEPIKAAVITDEKWLSFVVEQVLSNALKYTQAGSITIWLDGDKKLHIQDTGLGIAPEDLPRIFEKGYTGFHGRTDKRASGLGLYLCKRICQNLGHGIWAESVVGEGTAVTVDLAQKKVRPE